MSCRRDFWLIPFRAAMEYVERREGLCHRVGIGIGMEGVGLMALGLTDIPVIHRFGGGDVPHCHAKRFEECDVVRYAPAGLHAVHDLV